MKIRLSFVRPPLPWQPAALVLWVVAALATGAAFTFAAGASANRIERGQLELRLERANAQLAQRKPVQMPSAAETDALRRRIGELNGLAGVKGWNTPRLLEWLEQNTPADVHLVSVQHEPREGEVLLVAVSGTSAALTAFLRTLEREPQFAEVLLSKQGGRAGSPHTEFEIQLRLRA